jgi:hypothetical protein
LTLFHRNIELSGIDQRLRSDGRGGGGGSMMLPFAIPDDIGITPVHMQIYSDLVCDTIDELYASSSSPPQLDETTILLARAILHWSILGSEFPSCNNSNSISNSNGPIGVHSSLGEQIATVSAHFTSRQQHDDDDDDDLDREIARMEWRMVNAMVQAREVEASDMEVDDNARAHVQSFPFLSESHAATVKMSQCKFIQSAEHRRKHARLVQFIRGKLLLVADASSHNNNRDTTTTATAAKQLETPTNRWLVLDANVVFRPKH